MQITIYRGTHQIGGCITEIKTAQTRVLIDFGEELPRADATAPSELQIEGVTCGESNCDAVFVTHYHGDHVGLTGRVLPDIPIYMGVAAKQIYLTVQQTLQNKLHQSNVKRAQTFCTFEAGKPVFVKDVKITPYSVDHSAFDAYMFLIEAEGKRVLHTGDFRMHGAKGGKMPAVFAKYLQNIDALIVEGTMLSRSDDKTLSEWQLGQIARKILKNKYVFVLCSSTNIDTIAELYSAAIADKRLFVVCDEMQEQILRIVTQNSKSNLYNFDKQKVFVYGSNLHVLMKEKGFCFVGRANFATQKAMEVFPQNTLVYCAWKGYLDRNHPAFDEYRSLFVQNAVNNGSKLQYLHTAGHATARQLQFVCQATNAKTVIPIHTENPRAFEQLNIPGKITLLADGETFDF